MLDDLYVQIASAFNDKIASSVIEQVQLCIQTSQSEKRTIERTIYFEEALEIDRIAEFAKECKKIIPDYFQITMTSACSIEDSKVEIELETKIFNTKYLTRTRHSREVMANSFFRGERIKNSSFYNEAKYILKDEDQIDPTDFQIFELMQNEIGFLDQDDLYEFEKSMKATYSIAIAKEAT